ncbi:hypothetical protein [Nonomuraea sp. NPDC049625]|uniref:hypothetical protein n=1 Tax=Nonomuraea sp. NPDC049625 TaxID=3155775 RepID=UPI0034176DAD
MQAIVVFAGEGDQRAIGLELAGGHEGLFGVPVSDVVHRHGEAGVAGIALQDVDG